MATLHIIATPIGNLEDLSPRAARVLGEVDVIAAEDTRTTRRLLSHLGVRAKLVSFHAHTDPAKLAGLVARLEEGDMALVSEAGTPAVSDPGARLVAAALAAGQQVVSVPGPSAVTAALSVSGLPANAFVFIGFLPRRTSERRKLLAEVAREERTLVAFEAPHRLRDALEDLVNVLGGGRTVAVTRELTKMHEEVWRGTLEEARAHWAEREPRGEFTLVIGGAPEEAPEPWDEDRIRAALDQLRAQGMGAREASRHLAAGAGRPAREIYKLWEHDK